MTNSDHDYHTYFTEQNTENYSPLQLELANRRLARLANGLDPEKDADVIQHFAERVLTEIDSL